ncbi:MAG: sugar phosphate nucleotidyltransferase [Candidatus Lokiarchaeota archaeon]
MSQLENNQKVKHLSAVILCAGSGSRIKSISKSLPKPLIGIKSLNYKPILLTTIESLIKLGVTRIGIIIGFHAQKIKNYIENLKETIAFSHINFSLIDATKSFEFGPLYSFLSITTRNN